MKMILMMNFANCVRAAGCGLFKSSTCQRTFAKSANFNAQRTALYDLHLKMKGKMVNFGGYELPVQYADQSITASHLHVRQNAGIFDVSHMMQSYVHGKQAIDCIETLCTADLKAAKVGSSTLSVFTNAQAGILDDLIVTKVNDSLLYIVSNAAMSDQDAELMQTAVRQFQANKQDVSLEILNSNQQSLIALQGPAAASALAQHLPANVELKNLYFMNSLVCNVAGVPDCRITRCGYTGEDGFEISLASAHAQQLVETLLAHHSTQQVKLAGLGARDTLRLEAGLCLYGADINANITPVEAGLSWLIAKRRRIDLNFPGAEIIQQQLQSGVKQRRVGLKMLPSAANTPAARAGAKIYLHEKLIGHITSGAPSPSLKQNIAMAYVTDELKNSKEILHVEIRGKCFEAQICKMPFIKSNYYVKPKL